MTLREAIADLKNAIADLPLLEAELDVVTHAVQTLQAIAEKPDRASIAEFIAAEGAGFERLAAKAYERGIDAAHLWVKASLCRTLTAQVRRGDDRRPT